MFVSGVWLYGNLGTKLRESPLATEENCGPDAALMESMRAVGYSLPTAIADIIDNSIAAGARKIEVQFGGGLSPYVTIFDDGIGMSRSTLRVAMRLGGHSQKQRIATDLGRFGLGLKTASLSQCRSLTVVSKHQGVTEAVAWDLDRLAETGEWTLLALSSDEIAEIPDHNRLQSVDSGTIVAWTKMDRFSGPGHANGAGLDAEMVDVYEHVSLVFHQFLSGDHPHPRIAISINGRAVEPSDPFLALSPRTQKSPFESIDVEGVPIGVQAFTLPYLNKMTSTDRQRAGVRHGLRETQGFYVYRAGRLVVWGTWFRLMRRADASKLTRVKVDVPNDLDYLWSLDIRKSSAVPPRALRERLRTLAAKMVEPSESVHQFRGRKAQIDDDVSRLWVLIHDRDTFRYEINRDHPIVAEIQRGLTATQMASLDSLLELVETSFPAQDMHNRMASDQVVVDLNVDENALAEMALALWRGLNSGESLEQFAERVITFEPWHAFRGHVSHFSALLESRNERHPA